jgi:hypothetical protein
VTVTAGDDVLPATAVALVARRDGNAPSSELAAGSVFTPACVVAEVVVVGIRLTTAMPPVRPKRAATLSHPAHRRAPPAGCGRLRRLGVGGIARSWDWVGSQDPRGV